MPKGLDQDPTYTRRRGMLAMLAATISGASAHYLHAGTSIPTIPATKLLNPQSIDIALLNEQMIALKDPDFIPLPTGVLGSTYFKVGSSPRFPHDFGIRLFLNDVDVTYRSVESDCVGGWVRMFDTDANGRRITRSSLQKTGAGRFATAHAGRIRTYYGKVELRKTHPAKHEINASHRRFAGFDPVGRVVYGPDANNLYTIEVG